MMRKPALPSTTRSVFRATALLGSRSVVQAVLGLISIKVLATLLEPRGFGVLGLLQSLMQVGALVAGLGVTAGLVRSGASALARGDKAEFASLEKATWLVIASSCFFFTLVLAVLREPISRFVLPSEVPIWWVVAIGPAIFFSLAYLLTTNTLNAHHRIEVLARSGMVTTASNSLVMVVCVWVLGLDGVVWGLILGAASTFVISNHYMRKALGPSGHASWSQVKRSTKSLLSFGLPFMASAVVGTGFQMAMPLLVRHLLDVENVGFFRAAQSVVVTSLGFLLTANSQDYFPRVSAAAEDPVQLKNLLDVQHRFTLLVAAPITVCGIAAGHIFIPLAFSAQFTPTIDVLPWMLIGNLLRFASSTMSLVILSRSGSYVYLFVESVLGFTSVGATWLAVKWLGLPGVGIGFLIAYAVYYGLLWVLCKRVIGAGPSAQNLEMLAGTLATSLVILWISRGDWTLTRSVVASGIAIGVTGFCLRALWREMFRSSVAIGANDAVKRRNMDLKLASYAQLSVYKLELLSLESLTVVHDLIGRNGKIAPPILKLFSEAAKEGPLKVLDVGAFDRALGQALAKTNLPHSYHSVDSDRSLPQDFYDLKDVPQTYDVVCAFEVIEHMRLEEAGPFLDKLCGLVEPGGVLVLSTPNPAHPTRYFDDATHKQHWPARDLWAVLRSLGFRAQDIQPYRIVYLPPILWRRWLLIFRHVIWRILGLDPHGGFLFIAQKSEENPEKG